MAFGRAFEHVPVSVLYVRACVYTLCTCSRRSLVIDSAFSSCAVARDRLKDLPVSSHPVHLAGYGTPKVCLTHAC